LSLHLDFQIQPLSHVDCYIVALMPVLMVNLSYFVQTEKLVYFV